MAAQSVVAVEAIEAAMIERLRRGLGRMVRQVASYGGEFDEGLVEVVRQFPAAWVTFAGVTDTKAQSTSRVRYLVRGRFVVMVGARSIKAGDNRRGSAKDAGAVAQPGTYTLQHAVRRLLSNQDLGLDEVDVLRPGAVRTLFNGALNKQGFSIFACEFDVAWREAPLPAGRWPAPDAGNPDDVDAMFAAYQGQLDGPYPDWNTAQLDYRLPGGGAGGVPDASDVVTLQD